MVRGSRWFGVEGEATVADGCDSGLAEFDFHLLVRTTISTSGGSRMGHNVEVKVNKHRGLLCSDVVLGAAIPRHLLQFIFK